MEMIPVVPMLGAALVAVLVLASACTAASPEPPPIRPTTPSPSSAVGREIAQSVELPCNQLIDTADGPIEEHETILDVVQLPTASVTRALQTSRSAGPPPRYGSKRGLVIRSGAVFQLRVVGPADLDAALSWGSPGKPGRTVMVNGCQSSQKWLVFAGGYRTAKTGCLTVEVVTAAASQQVQIGVGKACEGKEPPAQPSDG